MEAHYLLRFDDICPTMDWTVWETIEELLLRHSIKPVLAVIPDNRDPKLVFGDPAPDFWERVRAWQARGWTICLHGYQHTYVNREPGLLRIGRKSEFAGLSYDEQFDKLSRGLAIFGREGVRAEGWIAPSHSFDWNTVAALSALGIPVISDGLALAPYRDAHGSIWVPQQFATMRPMPFGVWTFCYHYADLVPVELERFRSTLGRHAPRMISMDEAVSLARQGRTVADQAFALSRLLLSKLRGRDDS
jgi:peptidoglycan/xylan/chitin deacetylase (PgdA/CDA1 family)